MAASTFKIKVCGITQESNMLKIAALSPDYLGFIFYKPSPRDVSHSIKQLPLHQLPPSIGKVAVMVNIPLDSALDIVETYGFDLVQLHGQEGPGYCSEMRKQRPVIKSFSIKEQLPENLDYYYHSCDYFLFDTQSQLPGGSGKSFDHSILQDYREDVPFFLSGGIGPGYENKKKPLRHPALHALDINSRFEVRPGVKDTALVKSFIDKNREAQPEQQTQTQKL